MSVYVNICEWDRLPEPKSDEDPIPCVGGPLYELTDEQGWYILSNKKERLQYNYLHWSYTTYSGNDVTHNIVINI